MNEAEWQAGVTPETMLHGLSGLLNSRRKLHLFVCACCRRIWELLPDDECDADKAAQGAQALVHPYADPVPQALVLTAIVIGFGLLAFSLVLAHRVHATAGTDDIDEVGRQS